MLEFFKEIVQSNPALATMYSGGIVAMFVMHSKVIFGWVYTKLISLISFSISYNAKICNYESVPNKNLELLIKNQTHLFQNTYEINNKQEIGEGYGVTWLWMFKKLVYFSKSWESDANGVTLKIFLRVYFANKKKFIKKLEESLKDTVEAYDNKITVIQGYNEIKRTKRPLTSVYTNDNIGNKILNDIKHFLKSKNDYINNNILYKRNYLLYGVPGTGKSSLIFALASELNFQIKMISLKTIRDIDDLIWQISSPDRKIFVFEDIDCADTAVNNRVDNEMTGDIINPSRDNKITLSDILNVLDGLYTPEGIICFFTTNHIEQLDEAFLRDGRMDYKIELTDLNNEMANKMIFDKLGLDNLFKKEFINPATLQELIRQVKWNILTIDQFRKVINDDK